MSMARSTFKVLFYVNGSKEKDGIVPIMGRVTINGTVAQFSCKRTIPKELWDVKGNRAKGKSREAIATNLSLDNIKAQIIKHYQRLSDREAFVTAEMVRNAYQGLGSEYDTLMKAFDRDCASLFRARNNTARFIRHKYNRSDMSMLELTPDFIRDFAVYLSTVKGNRNATIWINCMWLKGVVMRAHFNGKIPRNPFELKTLVSHEFKDSHSAFVRDLFVFASFTALSFVDLKELTTDEIVEVNGEKWILAKRHKTQVPYQVKLLDIPLQIIDRYRPFQKDNSIFGDINYWTVCKKLKKVISECGITKDISFHCARHGFATLALSKGMPIESVSRVLGHTNIVTTQLYAKITTEKLDTDLSMLGSKLNASFGNIKMA